MVNYDERINDLKKRLEVAKNKKIKAEARLEELQNQRDVIIKQLKELGVEPENLDGELDALKREIEGLIKDVEGMLPPEM